MLVDTHQSSSDGGSERTPDRGWALTTGAVCPTV